MDAFPDGSPHPSPPPVRSHSSSLLRRRLVRPLRRWYRRTPTPQLVATLAACGVLVLLVVGSAVVLALH